MPFIESKSGAKPVNIFYTDQGEGKPLVFIHGWPLSHAMWEYQLAELPALGYRCIAYDRRGFGQSDKPWEGYNYNIFADDLKTLLDELDLNDVTLIGFSMGGGEVVRYMSKYAGARVSKIVLVSSVAGYMLKTDDNPDGVPQEAFDGFIQNIEKDRPAFLQEFGKGFYGVGLLSKPVSQGILDWSFSLALPATNRATTECVKAFSGTDFRNELLSINVPALVIHGDSDKTVPPKPTGEKAAELLPNAKLIIYKGAPHATFYTEREQFNADLIAFIGK